MTDQTDSVFRKWDSRDGTEPPSLYAKVTLPGDSALVRNGASSHMAVYARDGRLIARLPPDGSKYEVVDHDG